MYKYKVYGHDGTDFYNETGITVAASYQDAMKNLSDYYDEDSIINIKLYFITDDSVIPSRMIFPTEFSNLLSKSFLLEALFLLQKFKNYGIISIDKEERRKEYANRSLFSRL